MEEVWGRMNRGRKDTDRCRKEGGTDSKKNKNRRSRGRIWRNSDHEPSSILKLLPGSAPPRL